jgi:hypothetical protein
VTGEKAAGEKIGRLDRDRIKLTNARHCEKRSPFDKLRRSNPERAAALDCFASLAMTNQ